MNLDTLIQMELHSVPFYWILCGVPVLGVLVGCICRYIFLYNKNLSTVPSSQLLLFTILPLFGSAFTVLIAGYLHFAFVLSTDPGSSEASLYILLEWVLLIGALISPLQFIPIEQKVIAQKNNHPESLA